MMKRFGIRTLLVILILPFVFLFRNPGQAASDNSIQAGRQLFGLHCMPCHGNLGKGDGQVAYLLYPKPRDFTKGLFKLRSTPWGQVPTDEDLIKTLRSGMPGTAMPSFHFLKEEQLKQLISYVKELSQDCSQGQPCKKYFDNQNPKPVTVPEPLPPSDALIAKGNQAYHQMGCTLCHGESGTGDGPSAAGLKDAWDYPIKPRDFTQGTYLGGGSPRDLYLRFTTGLNGTPMPSFGDTMDHFAKTEQERQELAWGLVYYLKSLEKNQPKDSSHPPQPPKDGTIPVVRTDGSKKEIGLQDPFSPDWDKITPSSISLSRLWRKNSNNQMFVQVRAGYNEKVLAILLEWNDATQDAGTDRIQDFQDAAALQFSLTDTPVFLGMGQKGGPSNVWFWRSEWQMRAGNGSKTDIKQTYRNRASDADTGSYPAEIQEETRLSGRDAGNPVSQQTVHSPVEDVNATGLGTLTSQPQEQQDVLGKGEWNGKRWRVVFVRDLKNGDPNDVQFKKSGAYPVAFAVWNGSERDRNGQKLVSTWYSFRFEQ